jgi:hypothetical protein
MSIFFPGYFSKSFIVFQFHHSIQVYRVLVFSNLVLILLIFLKNLCLLSLPIFYCLIKIKPTY